jgi:DNA polymerase III epsilon subunit-like protein
VHAIVTDVETTGKRTPNARVIEVAAVVIDSRLKEIDEFHILTNPGEEALRYAAPEALRKNGISLDEIRSGLPLDQAALRLREFRAKYPGAKMHAFNNEFDMWFLGRYPWLVPAADWGECVMLASMELMEAANVLEMYSKSKVKWPNLDQAANFFGIHRDGSHRARPDARVTAKVYSEILRRRMNPMEETTLSEPKYIIEDGM